tara:strand:- start:5797 stop:6720 length:924 start_codon:yes stop_codon:yes gene_type:complete
MASVIQGTNLNVDNDFTYTKVKLNNGRKSVGILNKDNMKQLYLSTPLMLSWGVNEYVDDKSGVKTYDMALQFPKEEYNNPACVEFLKNMQAFEEKIKRDAIINSKDWLGKTKLESAVVDALWSPMLKYPKDKETNEPDYSRPPTLKVKIPYWEGEYKGVEVYDQEKNILFPSEESNDVDIQSLITKASNVATLIYCGGIWVANGKFGVTWKLFQAIVKPRISLSGKCQIELTGDDKNKLEKQVDDEDKDEKDDKSSETKPETTAVNDTDDEEENKTDQVDEIKPVVVEDVPKKTTKKVVKKKSASSE